MKWTKLKKLAEDRLCDSLKGRVAYQLVVHRKSHDQTRTFRVTLDRHEIFRASDIPFSMAANTRGIELTAERQIDPLAWVDNVGQLWQSPELTRLHAAYDDAELEVKEQGLFPAWEMVPLLYEFLQLPIEQALAHEHPFIRAISLLDRWIGRRRLAGMKPELEEALVRQFYEIRESAGKGIVIS